MNNGALDETESDLATVIIAAATGDPDGAFDGGDRKAWKKHSVGIGSRKQMEAEGVSY